MYKDVNEIFTSGRLENLHTNKQTVKTPEPTDHDWESNLHSNFLQSIPYPQIHFNDFSKI